MRRSTVLPLVSVLSFAVAMSGCRPHVDLNAPDATAPGPERVEAFKRLHGTSTHETHITYMNEYGAVTGAARRVDYIQLADGTRVYHPEDLKPVVAEESSAYEAAESSRKKKSTANTLNGIGWTAFAVGATIMFASIPALVDTENYTPLFVGAGVMLVGSGFTMASGFVRRKSMDEKATAFELYNDGLAMRLNVCANDEVLVPCESKVDAPVAAPPTPVAAGGQKPQGKRGPPGVAGFEFAMTEASARAACEAAGHEFTRKGQVHSCSSPAQSIGMAGEVQLLPCGNAYCQILVLGQPPEESILQETLSLKDALTNSYGAPKVTLSEVPEACQANVASCIDDGRAYLLYEWEFSSGQKIKLKLGKSPDLSDGATGSADRKVRLLYTKPQSGAARAL